MLKGLCHLVLIRPCKKATQFKARWQKDKIHYSVVPVSASFSFLIFPGKMSIDSITENFKTDSRLLALAR